MLKFLLMHFYWQIDWFVIRLARKYDQLEKKLLDIGANDCKYCRLFTKLQYFSQDIKQNESKTIDYVGDLETIKSAAFDYILCTQVLEHLPDPHKAFREFKRILKPGGKLLLTTNFIYQIHMEPNDYFRFTEHGLRYLGKANGLSVEELRPQGGIFGVLAYIIVTLPLRLGLERWRFSYWMYLILFSPLIMIINLMAVGLDKVFPSRRLVINYEAVYQA